MNHNHATKTAAAPVMKSDEVDALCPGAPGTAPARSKTLGGGGAHHAGLSRHSFSEGRNQNEGGPAVNQLPTSNTGSNPVKPVIFNSTFAITYKHQFSVPGGQTFASLFLCRSIVRPMNSQKSRLIVSNRTKSRNSPPPRIHTIHEPNNSFSLSLCGFVLLPFPPRRRPRPRFSVPIARTLWLRLRCASAVQNSQIKHNQG